MFTLVVVLCMQTQDCGLDTDTRVLRTVRDLSLSAWQAIAWPVINELSEPPNGSEYVPRCALQKSFDEVMRVRV
jgi:hypothetical protein